MERKYSINLTITDINGRYSNAIELYRDIKDHWLPVTHSLVINDLEVNMVMEVVDDHQVDA